MQPAFQRVNIEVKANWGRARKLHGKRATDVIVDVEKNPKVDVSMKVWHSFKSKR